MHPFLYGLYFGLILCFLVGPIFFALLQAGIERGFRAGLMIGFGVWISDLLFMVAVYFGVSYIVEITEWNGFEFTLGLVGGVILIVFGCGTILSPPPDIYASSTKSMAKRSASYLALSAKGFLINTINPFTFFFWISVMSTVVIKDEYDPQKAFYFFFGILLMIIITDILKIYLAKRIRKNLKQTHVLWMRRITGIALVVFGIVLMVRVTWFG